MGFTKGTMVINRPFLAHHHLFLTPTIWESNHLLKVHLVPFASLSEIQLPRFFHSLSPGWWGTTSLGDFSPRESTPRGAPHDVLFLSSCLEYTNGKKKKKRNWYFKSVTTDHYFRGFPSLSFFLGGGGVSKNRQPSTIKGGTISYCTPEWFFRLEQWPDDPQFYRVCNWRRFSENVLSWK